MTKLQQAQQLILNLGRVIRSMDEENEWLEYWTHDNDYQTNAEYQALFGSGAGTCQDLQAVHSALGSALAETDRFRTENEALRAALRIYADLENWLDGTAGVFGGDGGRIAREALSGKE